MILAIIILSLILLLILVSTIFLYKFLKKSFIFKKEIDNGIQILTYKQTEIIVLIESSCNEILRVYNLKYNKACNINSSKLWNEVDFYREILEKLNFKYFCLTGRDYVKFSDCPKQGELINSLN